MRRKGSGSHLVDHDPVWIRAYLPINAAGDTRLGWQCIHQLENGNGVCGGNVFELDQEVVPHSCLVYDDPDWRR